MDIGEYLDQLEQRAATLRAKYKDRTDAVSGIVGMSVDLASATLPQARKAIADIYVSLDALDKSFQTLEKLP